MTITIQETINKLTDLAREHGFEMLTTIKLESKGGSLSVFFTKDESDYLPREICLYFGSKDSYTDAFLFAFAIDPNIYIWASDEGLDESKATDAATRMIETIEDVEKYLLGSSYNFVKTKN